MTKEYDLRIRTKQFAHRCVKLGVALPKNTLGGHLANQLIHASTSVAANYRAAFIAQSKSSFIAKISIVFEECDETYFWIEFIKDEKLIKEKLIEELLKEADELTRIFAATRKKAVTNKLNNGK
jgi:four helix bundle protein